MTKNFGNCFIIMATALSLQSGHKLPELGRPLLQDLIPTKINISLSLLELKIESFRNLEVEMTALLNQKWVDPRLGANRKTRKMAVTGQVWKPKIVNINGDNKIQNSEDTVFWRGYGDEGHVVFSEKITTKISCTKNYHRFPFDTQMCQFKFGSFRFPQEEVLLIWDSPSAEITTDINFTEFKLIDTKTSIITDIRKTGNFSTAVFQLIFKRYYQFYVNYIMISTTIATFLNYALFWLSLSKRSIRLYINLAVFGFMLFSIYISSTFIPIRRYLSALEIFVLVGALFSLVTLIETIYVNSVCGLEEFNFHLRKVAGSEEYPTVVLWLELSIKWVYPVCYLIF